MQIKSFKATNYGPLEDLELHFSSDMNNISLPHGAGTTTILKTMYSIVESTRETTIEGKRRLLNEKLISVFPITTHSIGKLISQDSAAADVELEHSKGVCSFALSRKIKTIQPDITSSDEEFTSLYIPSRSVIEYAKDICGLYPEYHINISSATYELARHILGPHRNLSPSSFEIKLLRWLTELLNGTLEYEGGIFYLKRGKYKLEMSLCSEEEKKIAQLYQLIRNGFFLPGTIVFWDDFDRELRETIKKQLLNILLEISHTGVQIFLGRCDN